MGAAVLTIAGVTLVTGSSALAQTTDGQTNMITKLAQKLGVSEDKVKAAFDALHSERETEMKANLETKLSSFVSTGKITEAQKTAILAKMTELHTQMAANKETMKNLSNAERKAKMEARKTELENWVKSQGIDLSILPFGRGLGGHHRLLPTDGQ